MNDMDDSVLADVTQLAGAAPESWRLSDLAPIAGPLAAIAGTRAAAYPARLL